MTARYRPGSRVQQVWEVYEKDGPDKAFTFGITLNLAQTTLKSWVRMWSSGKAKVSATVAAPDRPSGAAIAFGRRRVCLSYWPERHGTVIQPGEEQSLVKFDDGHQQCFVNHWLKDLKE